MGKVITVLRINNAEGTSQEALIEELKKVEGFNSAKIEDYVFGTKIIKASFICEDSLSRDYEEIVSKVPGVESIQVEEVGLV
ncbi:Uncharacterised protein [uncultured archaeon]|nr:Uncharacterised protein [uncultured archaeon]